MDGSFEDLHAIAYVSSVTGLPTLRDIDAIIEQSRRNNVVYGVTGALAYCNGCFFQYIEGPTESIRALMKRISDDSRHHQVTIVLDEAIGHRDFQEWSAGYSQGIGNAKLDDVTAAVLRRTPRSLSAPKRLLHTFWNQNSMQQSS